MEKQNTREIDEREINEAISRLVDYCRKYRIVGLTREVEKYNCRFQYFDRGPRR